MDKRPSNKVIGKINEFIYCYRINTQVRSLNSTDFQVYTQYRIITWHNFSGWKD